MLRWSSVVFTLLIAVAAWGLFHTSYEVRQLEGQLASLNRDIVEEQEAISVLTAEWAYLNRPERLSTLAHDLTRLTPIGPDQIIDAASELPFPLPILEPASTPLAPVVLEGAMAGLPLPPGRPQAGDPASTFIVGGQTDVSALADGARLSAMDLVPVRHEQPVQDPATPTGLGAALPLVVPTGLGALIEGDAR